MCLKYCLSLLAGLLLGLNLSVVFAEEFTILTNADDGTEVNGMVWLQSGEKSANYLGRKSNERYRVGLRFSASTLEQGDAVAYARLRFASKGGEISGGLKVIADGVLSVSSNPFSQMNRPSLMNPKTRNKEVFTINNGWEKGTNKVPLYYSSPDLSPIINEILSLPDWGLDAAHKIFILTLRDLNDDSQSNFVKFDDFHGGYQTRAPAILEVYRTIYDTFIGKELLGRVTDSSITMQLYSLIDTDLYVEYGTTSGIYPNKTRAFLNQPAEQTIELVLNSLQPDTNYYYRLAYRKAGQGRFQKGPERTFHTQRRRGAPFSFAIQSDEHLQKMYMLPKKKSAMKLYQTTLANIAAGAPDFFISLGDFAHTEFIMGRNAQNQMDANDRYLRQRQYLESIAHSIPFYLTLGNHEGEQGWQFDQSAVWMPDNWGLGALSLKARKSFIANPRPNRFYSGNTDLSSSAVRENYFSWEWGDALFVVLDPYWSTKTKPNESMDGWDWTLGQEQYNWLYEVLHGSTVRWKFVFIHQLTSTCFDAPTPYYGRGGIEVAKFKVDSRPSFEWGGEDEQGNEVFSIRRPGWIHGPTHDMLVAENVSIIFHGHDHLFVKQDLDGIVYQECPQPGDTQYSYGTLLKSGYIHGDIYPNSGHLHVSVRPESVKVDYVRAFLPGYGENGKIAFTYILHD